MPSGAQSEHVVTSEDPPEPEANVSACQTRPGRLVFLEAENTDGWIATDHVVQLSA